MQYLFRIGTAGQASSGTQRGEVWVFIRRLIGPSSSAALDLQSSFDDSMCDNPMAEVISHGIERRESI